MPQQALKGRDEKCGRLAGAGLCLARDIMLLERERQCAGLNGRTELEARVSNAGAHGLVKLQTVESEVAQMVIGHEYPVRKCGPKACKLPREGVKLAQYRRDSRRTCQIRHHRNPREAAIKLRHIA